jgi:raffinose/stachyose/melibiose transport system permease protein
MRSFRRGYFRRENWTWYTLASFIIGIWCLISIILFLNVLVSSFKSNIDILTHPWALPKVLILDNYIRLLNGGFLKYYLNSFTVLIFSIVLILSFSAPAAYGLGKFKFKGNQILRIFFLVGLMFPVQLGIIPLFNLLGSLHLVNTLWGIILINTAGLSVPVFVLTNFTKNIPDALREAAWMDGEVSSGFSRSFSFPL